MNEYPAFRSRDVVLYDNYIVSLRRKLDRQCRFYLPMRYLPTAWELHKQYRVATIKGFDRIIVSVLSYEELTELFPLGLVCTAHEHGKKRISIPVQIRGHLPPQSKIIIEVYNDLYFLLKVDY